MRYVAVLVGTAAKVPTGGWGKEVDMPQVAEVRGWIRDGRDATVEMARDAAPGLRPTVAHGIGPEATAGKSRFAREARMTRWARRDSTARPTANF